MDVHNSQEGERRFELPPRFKAYDVLQKTLQKYFLEQQAKGHDWDNMEFSHQVEDLELSSVGTDQVALLLMRKSDDGLLEVILDLYRDGVKYADPQDKEQLKATMDAIHELTNGFAYTEEEKAEYRIIFSPERAPVLASSHLLDEKAAQQHVESGEQEWGRTINASNPRELTDEEALGLQELITRQVEKME